MAILAVIVFGKITDRTGKERNDIQQWPEWIYLSCLILFLLIGIKDSMDYAKSWTASSADGQDGICTALYSLSEENEEMAVLSDDSEHSASITAWLEARDRKITRYTFDNIKNLDGCRIIVIERDIEDGEELLKAINWKGCEEVYKNNGFVIWIQEN